MGARMCTGWTGLAYVGGTCMGHVWDMYGICMGYVWAPRLVGEQSPDVLSECSPSARCAVNRELLLVAEVRLAPATWTPQQQRRSGARTCHVDATTTATIGGSHLPRGRHNLYKVTLKPALPPLPTMYPRVQTLCSVPRMNRHHNNKGSLSPLPELLEPVSHVDT